ncbi:Plasmodium exported protein, unknown function [Plasmodium sp. DRC-Itaito]|nr:Plasmodium exported protein, unknown function [Plasmodium sp. DRC-Itaito]
MIYLRQDKLRYCFYFYVQLFIVYLFICTENKYNQYGGCKNFNVELHFEESLRLKEYRILVEYTNSYMYEEPKVRFINHDDDKNEEYPSRYDNKNLEESFEDYVDNYEYTLGDKIPESVNLENDSNIDTIGVLDLSDENNVEVIFSYKNINEKNINNVNMDELKSFIDTRSEENQTKMWDEYINNIENITPKSIEYKYKYHTSTKRNLRSFIKYAKSTLKLLYKIIKYILITIYNIIKYIIVAIFTTLESII